MGLFYKMSKANLKNIEEDYQNSKNKDYDDLYKLLIQEQSWLENRLRVVRTTKQKLKLKK